MAESQGRSARISTAYVQLVPSAMGFAEAMQKELDKASSKITFQKLIDKLKQAGRKGGTGFKSNFQTAADNPHINFDKTIRDAGNAGTTGGKRFKARLEAAANGVSVDFNRLRTEASQAGAQAGQAAGMSFQQQMEAGVAATNMDPNRRVAPWAQAGNRAGDAFGDAASQQIQNAPLTPDPADSQADGDAAGSAWADGFLGAAQGVAGFITGAGTFNLAKTGATTVMDFDKEARRISSGLGATDDASIKRTEEALKHVFEQGFTFEESTMAVESSLSANPELIKDTQENINKASLQLMKLGSQYEIDLGQMAQVANQMNRHGLVGSYEEGISLAGVSMSKLSVPLREEYTAMMGEYARNFSGMGLTGQEASLLITLAGQDNNTYGMDNMSDFVKESSLMLGNTSTTTSQEGMKMIGIEDPERISKMVQEGGEQANAAMREVISYLANVEDVAERRRLAIDIFGAPLEEMSPQKIDDVLARYATVEDFSKDINADFEKQSVANLENFHHELAKIGNSLTLILAEGIQPVIEWLMPHVQAFGGWLKENEETLKAFVPPLLAVGFVLSLIMGLGFLSMLIGAAAALAPVISGLSIVSFGAIAAGGAIIATVAAIGTFIYGLYNDYEGTMDWIEEHLGWFGGQIRGFVDGLGFTLALIWHNVVTRWNQDWAPIKEFIDGIIQGIQKIIEKVKEAGGVFKAGFGSEHKFGTEEWGMGVVNAGRQFFGLTPMATGGDVVGPTAILAGEKEPETIMNRGVANKAFDAMADELNRRDQERTVVLAPNITVNPAAGMDERALADAVVNRLARERTRIR